MGQTNSWARIQTVFKEELAAQRAAIAFAPVGPMLLLLRAISSKLLTFFFLSALPKASAPSSPRLLKPSLRTERKERLSLAAKKGELFETLRAAYMILVSEVLRAQKAASA